MASIADSIQLTLEQKIVPTIFEQGWDLDAVYPLIARSFSNVVRNQGIGRNYQVLKTFGLGMSGGARFNSPLGGNVLSGPNNFVVYDTPQTFPGVDEVVAPAFVQLTIPLIEHRGNFYLPHQVLRSDKLNASIGSVVAKNLSGVGELLAQQEMAVFYSPSPSSGVLGSVGDTSVNVTNGADTSSVIVNLAGLNSTGGTQTHRVHRFRQGLRVDLYKSDLSVKRNQGYFLVIDYVDPMKQTIQVRRVDGGSFQTSTTLGGGTTFAGTGSDNDVLVIADSVGFCPKGLESWIADGTTVTSFFGISTANFPQFRSYVSALSGTVASPTPVALTESQLNKHIGYFLESFPGKKIPQAITTTGVLMGFIDNLDNQSAGSTVAQYGRGRYDRNGEYLDVAAGWKSFNYRFGSHEMEILTSTYCAKNTFYAGKIRDGGLTRYVPPPIPGAKVDSRFGAEVEFVANLGGTGGYMGIFKHAHSPGGNTTDFIEAPFVRQWNILPANANWMKLVGITELWDGLTT